MCLNVFYQGASEVSGYGIRFNALCPTFVQTDLIANASANLGPFSHLAEVAGQIKEKLGVIRSEFSSFFHAIVFDPNITPTLQRVRGGQGSHGAGDG